MLLLVSAALYVLWCEQGKVRKFKLPGVQVDLPAGRVAVGQIGLSMLHWLLIGTVIWMLLPRGLPYPTVLGTLLTAAVAGAVIHVPGGLGVIEAVFVAVLGERVQQGALIAALLAYRACFYPQQNLVVAAPVWLMIGIRRAEEARTRASDAAPPPLTDTHDGSILDGPGRSRLEH